MKHITLFFALFLCPYCVSAQQIEVSKEEYQKLNQSENRFSELFKMYHSLKRVMQQVNDEAIEFDTKELEGKREELRTEYYEHKEASRLEAIRNNRLSVVRDSLYYVLHQNLKKKSELYRVIESRKQASILYTTQRLLKIDTAMLHKSRQVLQDNIYEKQEKIYSLKRSKDSITILKKDITLLENSLKDKYANNKTKIQTFNEFQKVENDKNILETQINRNKEKIKQQFPQKVAKHLQDKTYNLPKTDALLRYCAEIKDFVAVDSLETALLAYRKLCTSVIDDKEYKAILSRKYDKKVVENALIKLSNTTSDNQEQIAYYTNLLQNYCKMNKIVVFIAQGIKSNLPDYPADAKKSLHDFLKEHGERLKPYLYLMNELSQKQKNISYDMNVTETPCK